MAERALHVGIDARELAGHATGVGRYLSNVLRVWAADPLTSHRFTLFAPAALPAASLPSSDRVRVVTSATSRAGTWWEQMILPGAAKREAVDVLLSPGYTRPLRRSCPSVVVIHDVSFFAHPEWFRPREGWRRRWLTRAGARRADAIVTISEFSAGELVRWLGVPRARITLAYPGAPAPVIDVASPRAPVVLYVGSIFTRRRIPELLEAFAAVRRRVADARLVIVGDNRTHPHVDVAAMIAGAGLSSVADWRRYASDAELDACYGRARVFAFLSDYEGFAMTPLEAMAHGATPVLLDTAVAREVYGDAATFVPPDVAATADALTTLLTDDDAWRALLARGRHRLEQFTWTTTARIILDVLAQAARS